MSPETQQFLGFVTLTQLPWIVYLACYIGLRQGFPIRLNIFSGTLLLTCTMVAGTCIYTGLLLLITSIHGGPLVQITVPGYQPAPIIIQKARPSIIQPLP